MTPQIPVITVDGPAGVGKGTVSAQLAQQLGWHILDSGALYRIVAWAALRQNANLADETALIALIPAVNCHFYPQDGVVKIIALEEDITQSVRSEALGQAASEIAVLPNLRQALLQTQRAYRQAPGLIADGRDMGTVVFPDAPVKIYLTATANERAQRRYKQLKEQGVCVKLPELIKEIVARDYRDRTRSHAPLRAAEDAVIIDTTHLSIIQVVESVINVYTQYTQRHPKPT